MLSELMIENFALIQQHCLEFQAGMTVLTGETGAGKSIIIDALSLVLGARADSHIIRQGTNRCQIRARFDLQPKSLAEQWLAQHQLDSEGECLIHRSITRDGKSRATINGHPVTVQQLRQFSECLINIHGQHEHQALLKKSHQRDLVDHYGQHQALVTAVNQHYEAWHNVKQQQQALFTRQDQHSRQEFLHFQLEEWQAIALTAEAITALEQEHTLLAHAEERLQAIQQAWQFLNQEEAPSVSQTLQMAQQSLSHLDPMPAPITNALQAIDSALIQVEEASHDLQHYLHHTELNPERLAEIDQTLQSLHRLARKHRVSPRELPAFYQALNEELQQLATSEQQLAQLEQALQQHTQAYQQAAHQLSQKRQQTAQKLAKAIEQRMQQLAMPGGQFAIHFDALADSEPHLGGNETLEFHVSANPGQPLQALSKVASGGELSRISLAIQVILAGSTTIPTLVFDEVDVGIGGPTAVMVGQVLQDLSQYAQILCITHLPQVAACGHHHFQIAKHIEDQQTLTQVTPLANEHRQHEIARMLGGINPTSLAHAKELLSA